MHRLQTRPARAPVVQAKCSCGGTCPDCEAAAPLQTKLAVSSRHDSHEHEADRVARHVINNTETGSSGSRIAITRVPQPGGAARLPALERRGEPLAASARAFFEDRFGHDFSSVRVHTDSGADAMARSIGARAFTYANHIVFRAGEYDPSRSSGRELLAHELTHTIQQNASGGPVLLQRQDDGMEMTDAGAGTPDAGDAGTDAPQKPKVDCDTLCKSLESMRSAAKRLCELAGQDDPRCVSAKERVKNSESRIAEAGCNCNANFPSS